VFFLILIHLGSSVSPSGNQKLSLCLQATCFSFDIDLQFEILIQFIKEKDKTLNLKVKLKVLEYLKVIIFLMKLHSSDDLKYAICWVVLLTAEPKSMFII